MHAHPCPVADNVAGRGTLRHSSTGPPDRVKGDLHFDYTTIGHVTIDVLEDGSRRAGGAAFYSALQASRLGLHTSIITQGLAREIEEVLAPYRAELELTILPAAHTTILRTAGSGSARVQRVLAWAGPIEQGLAVDTSILHLAPVARESPAHWSGRADFLGLTPQGLVREWDGDGAVMRSAAPTSVDEGVGERCDAIVVNAQERAGCARLIAAGRAGGAIVAVTAGGGPNAILLPDGSTLELEVPEILDPADDLGAGDVFAAAFFVALAHARSPREAAGFANAAAAVRMLGEGADAVGGREAIETRLRG